MNVYVLGAVGVHTLGTLWALAIKQIENNNTTNTHFMFTLAYESTTIGSNSFPEYVLTAYQAAVLTMN